jgi:hypothetical protein
VIVNTDPEIVPRPSACAIDPTTTAAGATAPGAFGNVSPGKYNVTPSNIKYPFGCCATMII